MLNMVIFHVSIHVKPEHIEAFKAATVENARHSIEEPGVVRFDFIQQSDDAARFMLLEVYRDVAAQASHKETAHYRVWADKVGDMLAEPRRRLTYTGVYPPEAEW